MRTRKKFRKDRKIAMDGYYTKGKKTGYSRSIIMLESSNYTIVIRMARKTENL